VAACSDLATPVKKLGRNHPVLAYTEHLFNVAPLNQQDATAYDLSNSFNYAQTPTKTFQFQPTTIPTTSLTYLKAHPAPPDDT